MNRCIAKLVPWLLLTLFAAQFVLVFVPPTEHGFHYRNLGLIPVVYNGRVQPLDTLARNTLRQIRRATTVPLDETRSFQLWRRPKKLDATAWLAEVLLNPTVADTRRIFMIHNPELMDALDLDSMGVQRSGLFYFSFNELTNAFHKIASEARLAASVEPQTRTVYQKQVLELFNALAVYQQLKNSLQPDDATNFVTELAMFEDSISPGTAALKARSAGADFDRAALDRFVGFLARYEHMSRACAALIVPPEPADPPDNWRSIGQVLFDSGVRTGKIPLQVKLLAQMADAFRQSDCAAFNHALQAYLAWLKTNAGHVLAKAKTELFYNRLEPFLRALKIYLGAFVLATVAMLTVHVWPTGSDTIRRSAFWLATLAFVLHTTGLTLRMWIERRPPVTNLYSSAVFVGWVAVLLGLLIERRWRVGIGTAAGALIGFATLIIAHNLSLGSDTMEALRAVLDTNFWLAAHVVTITLGYGAVFMAGLLGIAYVLLGLFTTFLSLNLGSRTNCAVLAKEKPHSRPVSPEIAVPGTVHHPVTNLGDALLNMVYGTVCFALLFSFTGTVLGGLWADRAWGRFWGWDPKENGALMVVLWNALVLHALRAGLVRERGLANLAIFGNVVTSFSWFGVNMLGVGLHSYGFMEGGFKWLLLFVASQLLVIVLGTLPKKLWRSYRKAA